MGRVVIRDRGADSCPGEQTALRACAQIRFALIFWSVSNHKESIMYIGGGLLLLIIILFLVLR